jgi:hypothetical protein
VPRKPNEIVGLQLRFPERLRRKIEEAAKKNDRSMNLEIVTRLEESFTRPALLDEVRTGIEKVVAPALTRAYLERSAVLRAEAENTTEPIARGMLLSTAEAMERVAGFLVEPLRQKASGED